MSNIKNPILLILVLTIIGAFFHFYNLNWGAPYYFHPDERNIASAVTQLSFPSQMNPHFFAYGSLPIYVIYITGVLMNFIGKLSILNSHLSTFHISFEQAIIISRFYSALMSTLLVPLLFVIARSIATKQSRSDAQESMGLPRSVYPEQSRRARNDSVGLIAAFLATTSVGFIQFAHFGTFEIWLTFFSTLLLYICIKALHATKTSNTILLGGIFGILVATKISHLAILPLPLAAIILQKTKEHTSKVKKAVQIISGVLIFISLSYLVYAFSNPFVYLDTNSFLNSMHYESSVALGTMHVFYTGEFYQSIPIVFQFIHVYPFLINSLLTLIFIPALIYIVYKIIKTRHLPTLLLTSCFLLLFLSQAFFYVKWTRYMMPTIPFMFLILAIAISDFLQLFKKTPSIKYLLITILLLINSIFALSYLITVFVEPDSRILARDFARKNFSPNNQIISEVYDLGITPFNSAFPNISLFNFYDLDNNSVQSSPLTLQASLDSADAIILPSQRILKARLQNPKQFPLGHNFYQSLLNGSSGFKKIYETPCDIFCNITYLGSPIYSFEETANVFDRPMVVIFKNIMSKE